MANGDLPLSSWQKQAIGWIIVVVLGGNAGAMLNLSRSTSDGEALEHRVDEIYAVQRTMIHRMSQQEKWRDRCRDRVNKHLIGHP